MRALTLFGLSISLVFGAMASASEPSPLISPLEWQTLLYRCISKGVPTEMDNGRLMVLSHIVPPDLRAAHQADYFSTLGAVSNGQFQALRVYVVSENWQFNSEKNWTVDQWLYVADLSGGLLNVAHFELVETPTGTVLSHTAIPTAGIQAPAIRKQWDQQLGLWSGWSATEDLGRPVDVSTFIGHLR